MGVLLPDNFDDVYPSGKYEAIIKSFEERNSKVNGEPILVCTFELQDGKCLQRFFGLRFPITVVKYFELPINPNSTTEYNLTKLLVGKTKIIEVEAITFYGHLINRVK